MSDRIRFADGCRRFARRDAYLHAVLDQRMRRLVAPPLAHASAVLDRSGISANAVTGVGAFIGVAGCVCIAFGRFLPGLALFLANRVIDGLDGPLARRRPPTVTGPMLDLLADHLIYEGVVVAMAIVRPEARLASVVLVSTYVINSVSVLITGQVMNDYDMAGGDERGLRLPSGLAEGTETIVVYVLMMLFPDVYELLAWGFSAAVMFTVGQRLFVLRRLFAVVGPGLARPSESQHKPTGEREGDQEAGRRPEAE